MARRIKSKSIARPEAVSIDGPGPRNARPLRRKSAGGGVRRLDRKSGQLRKMTK